MPQALHYPQGFAMVVTAASKTSQLALTLPFDAARETYAKAVRTGFIADSMLERIPVNVTADSGNVTGIPANVTDGRCCAF